MKWFDRLKNWCIKKLGGYTTDEYVQQKSMYDQLSLRNRSLESDCDSLRARSREIERRFDIIKEEYHRFKEYYNPLYVHAKFHDVEPLDYYFNIAVSDQDAPDLKGLLFKEHLSSPSFSEIMQRCCAVQRRYDPRLMATIYTVHISVNNISFLSKDIDWR